MATVPLIFPSLSRQPSMDSSKSVDDDTIRDQMESGYVATRPRFTRARRTWKINVRNLQAEDMRVLDQFFMVTSARGANSFLYPNLLPNGSFEFPAQSDADVAYGWNISSGPPQEAISIGTVTVEDGTHALSFTTVAGQSIPATSTVTGTACADQPISCTPGEVYTLTASASAVQGTLAAGVLSSYARISFFDADGNPLSTLTGGNVPVGTGWQTYSYQFTVPANAASFSVSLNVSLANTAGAALNIDASASVAWDVVACALLTPITPFGRMAGSQPLGCFVRFSKLPETSDIGVGTGVKRYGANFELTEV